MLYCNTQLNKQHLTHTTKLAIQCSCVKKKSQFRKHIQMTSSTATCSHYYTQNQVWNTRKLKGSFTPFIGKVKFIKFKCSFPSNHNFQSYTIW